MRLQPGQHRPGRRGRAHAQLRAQPPHQVAADDERPGAVPCRIQLLHQHPVRGLVQRREGAPGGGPGGGCRPGRPLP